VICRASHAAVGSRVTSKVATIEPDEQGAVDPTQMSVDARRAPLQDVELTPQYQDFGFHPRRGLKKSHSIRTNKRPIGNIRRSCSDSSVMRFSVRSGETPIVSKRSSSLADRNRVGTQASHGNTTGDCVAATIEDPADGPATTVERQNRSVILHRCLTKLSPAPRGDPSRLLSREKDRRGGSIYWCANQHCEDTDILCEKPDGGATGGGRRRQSVGGNLALAFTHILTRTYLKIADCCRSVGSRTSSGNASGIIFRRRILAMDVANRLRRVVCLKRYCGQDHRRAMAHAAAELPELQNCTSALSDLVPY
jgi:hypothetical protein